ncbi:unnamed protein product [Spirodela intermedia]|uniref:Uncharacterized protein n=1 Tax=Spirodela intermedia TaxID=51605 RepID=A0A7I8IA91_SPIIN|nr:unnamed protein product [Spirodela intermedia]CAA6654595.1 unnamed protein product [Spirodela intermedia]
MDASLCFSATFAPRSAAAVVLPRRGRGQGGSNGGGPLSASHTMFRNLAAALYQHTLRWRTRGELCTTGDQPPGHRRSNSDEEPWGKREKKQHGKAPEEGEKQQEEEGEKQQEEEEEIITPDSGNDSWDCLFLCFGSSGLLWRVVCIIQEEMI